MKRVKDQKSILELQSRDDIVITDADIGGKIEIFVEDYIKESGRQLYNTETIKDWIRIQLQPTAKLSPT